MLKKIVVFLSLLGAVGAYLINKNFPLFTPPAGGWSIGFGFQNPSKAFDINNKHILSKEDYNKNFDHENIFIADPFYIIHNDTSYIFYENSTTEENRGAKISYIKSADLIHYEKGENVLVEPFHMSYPGVFKHDTSIYILPETQQANNVLLYRASNFPNEWYICDTLIKDIKMKDPTLLFTDKFVYMFGSDDNELYYYKADSLFGNWKKYGKKHLRYGHENRCGGRIFKNENGDYILPLQNTSHGYGYGISFYKINIDQNDEISLERTNKLYLKPLDNVKEFSAGMHHIDIQNLNGDSTYVVFDGNVKLEGEKIFNYKRSLKHTLSAIKNWF